MKRFSMLLIIAMTLALLMSATVYGQSNSSSDKNFSGQLLKVDDDAKAITVQDPDGKVMTFRYTRDTNIVRPDNTPQGIAGKTGSRVLITYHEEKDASWATRIELSE